MVNSKQVNQVDNILSESQENWKQVKVRKEVYDALVRLQGLLQFITGKKVSLSDIIAYALEKLPPISIPVTDMGSLVLVKEENVNKEETGK